MRMEARFRKKMKCQLIKYNFWIRIWIEILYLFYILYIYSYKKIMLEVIFIVRFIVNKKKIKIIIKL